MRESAMTPEVAVADAEVEANDIEVGYHRTNSSCNPDSFGDAGAIEAGSNAQGGDGVGKSGCQGQVL